MQLGGNANALTFFRQHDCTRADARLKYASRAAQLYREKLHRMAIQAMRLHGTQLSAADPAMSLTKGQQNVEAALSTQPDAAQQELRKPTIGSRRPQAKRVGLGAKKGGLGAQKGKVDFAEREREAARADELKVQAAEEAKLMAEKTAEEEQKQIAPMQIAYQDLRLQQKKKEQEKLKQVDPMNAQLIERLEMGFASRTGVSHSALSDMKTIEQESPSKAISSSAKSVFDRDRFFDDFLFSSPSSGFGWYKSSPKEPSNVQNEIGKSCMVPVITESDAPKEQYRSVGLNEPSNVQNEIGNSCMVPVITESDVPKEQYRSVGLSEPSNLQDEIGNSCMVPLIINTDVPNEQRHHYELSKYPHSHAIGVGPYWCREMSCYTYGKGRGITGLKNLGNSCYMNSIIQCINNTTPLALYFCKGAYLEDVNYDNNGTRGEVAEEVAAVVSALWSGQYRSIACRDLKNVVGRHRKQFQGCEQQDSHEFLTILMDWLHEDLNKRSRRSPLRETSNDKLSPADQAWEKFQRCNTSLIRRLFYGQQKSTIRCCKCGEESATFEPFSDLSLALPSSSNKCSLAECMELYLNSENISGWNCPSCEEKCDAIKKFDIWRLPFILVIHLNRFYHVGWWRKRQTYVDFPFNLDVHHFTLVPNHRHVNYKLYGVSNHYGSMEGGHYTAYCKNELYDKWYKFDDHEVSEISDNDVRSSAAYILFYTSMEASGNSSERAISR
jgi:ubiquitin carboxyl-terminal hydrolase 8